MSDKYKSNRLKNLAVLLMISLIMVSYFTVAEKKAPTDAVSIRAAKTVSVDTFSSLEKALEDSEEATIKLKDNITLTDRITIRGTKKIVGGGFYIRRKAASGSEYKNTMFNVGKANSFKGTLTLEGVIIDGGGDSDTLKDRMQGRLIEVFYKGSSLTLNSGTILKKNYNTSDCIDGGGGVTISNGCSMTMNAGSEIRDNKTVIGGAAVRVQSGGTFHMKGGTISGNTVNGKESNENDCNGRGGALHNSGTVNLEGGTISGNKANGYVSGGKNAGGLGGGVYNLSKLNLKGTVVNANGSLCGGGGIYTTGTGAEVNMASGELKSNEAKEAMGGGIYVNNGSKFTFSGGSIYLNQALTGGGIYVSKENSQVLMSGGGVFSNKGLAKGTAVGGGIRNNGSKMEIRGGKIGFNLSGTAANNTSPNSQEGGYSAEFYNNGTLKIENISMCMNQGGTYPFVNSGTLLYNGGVLSGTGAAGVLNTGSMTFGQVSGTANPKIESRFTTGVENRKTIVVNRGILLGIVAGLLNKGSATIVGGSIGENGDYGIQAHSGDIRIQGGKIQGKKYSLYGGGGDIKLDKQPNVAAIFLKKGIYIQVPAALTGTGGGAIQPEDYVKGRLLVKTTYSGGSGKAVKSMFRMVPFKNYYMYEEETGLYVGEKVYEVSFHANGGTGTMNRTKFPSGVPTGLPKNQFTKKGYQFMGWSTKMVNKGSKKLIEFKDQEKIVDLAEHEEEVTLYAVWRKFPQINISSELLFYEGEQVPISILKSYVEAQDEIDGDITKDIVISHIEYENGKTVGSPSKILTEEAYIGVSKVIFNVKNSDDCQSDAQMEITIKKNKTPDIIAPDRYLFLSEVSEKSKSERMEILREKVQFLDDMESEEELLKNSALDISEVSFEEEGEFKVTVTAKDQYGHRFYMEKDEKSQYGIGKEKKVTFLVHMVEEEKEKQKEGHVRFVSKEYIDTFHEKSKWSEGAPREKLLQTLEQSNEQQCRQVWKFSREDILNAKSYAKGTSNPFSAETNRGFYDMLVSMNCLNFERG